MSHSTQQYPFTFQPNHSFAPEDYIITECNAALCEQLVASQAPVICVSGTKGSGKTHLMQWLKQQGKRLSIDAATLSKQPADQWMKAEESYLIDDIERIKNGSSLAQAINMARALPTQLILTYTTPLNAEALDLPDVTSRLKAAQQFHMPPPDDTLLQALLLKYLSDLQWRCEPEVIQYIVTRLPRDMATLKQFVTLANQHAMAEKRALTIPFASKTLNLLEVDH